VREAVDPTANIGGRDQNYETKPIENMA
jgi:hypothetical protein